MFFDGSDPAIHDVYLMLYEEVLQRRGVWLKETREVALQEDQIRELFSIAKVPNLKHWLSNYDAKVPMVGMQICSSGEERIGSTVEELVRSKFKGVKCLTTTEREAVDSMATKFFKEFNVEDKGQKIN